MATITTSTGLYSGLNTGDIIDKLMAIEQQPLDNLNTKKASYQSEISAYGDITSSISALRTAVKGLTSQNVASSSVTSSDTTVLNASVSSQTSVSSGQYNVTVVNTALDEKLRSQAYDSSSAVFKTGTLTVRNGNSSKDIAITASNNTLSGIAGAINSAGVGVSASIVHDSTGYKMVLSAAGGGASGDINVSGADGGPVGLSLSGLNYDSEFGGSGNGMTLMQSGRDAEVNIDGMTVTSHSNTLTDAISGLTLNLLKKSPSSGGSQESLQLTVSQNPMSSSTNIKAFVDSYNSVITKLNADYAKGQPLANDNTVTDILSQLRQVTTTTYGGKTLAQYGISHDKTGALQIESSKVDSSATADQSGFYNTINAFSTGFDNILKNIVLTLIPTRTNTLSTQVTQLTSDADQMTTSLAQTKTSLQNKFAAMEATIADLQTQSASMGGTTSASTTGITAKVI
ncbi:MAG: flagellar filament capping protein FliD [Nitrospirae bacterium]|nr:flagellar filament capping protein FliD [Nitrospirota bacterium]